MMHTSRNKARFLMFIASLLNVAAELNWATELNSVFRIPHAVEHKGTTGEPDTTPTELVLHYLSIAAILPLY